MMTAFVIGILILLAGIVYFFFFPKGDSAASESDAKRFARLLMMEIKLYENDKIEQGLRNNNLYEALFERIEESRKMYRKRILNAEHERFFDEALIEILANGDRSKLGQIRSSLN
jgi:hypothetical protein